MSDQYLIQINRGETLVLDDNRIEETPGVGMDLTGATLSVVQSNFETDPALAWVHSGSGKFKITFSSALTAALQSGKEYYILPGATLSGDTHAPGYLRFIVE